MSGTVQHSTLAAGRWFEFSLCEQLANVGSEVIRSIKWKDRNRDFSQKAAERALELLCLTIEDPQHRGRLRELTRLYEVLVNDLYGFDDFVPDLPRLEKYFLAFTVAASRERMTA